MQTIESSKHQAWRSGGHGIREAGPLGDSLVAFTLP